MADWTAARGAGAVLLFAWVVLLPAVARALPTTTAPDQTAATQPAEPTPPEARALLDTLRRMAPGQVDTRDAKALLEYSIRLKRANEALTQLQAKFPAVAARAEVQTVALTVLFEMAYIQDDSNMEALRVMIARLLTDPATTRGVKALARYHLLNADLARRRVAEPTSQPDQWPAWLGEELSRRVAFARDYRDQAIGQRAFAEAILLKAQMGGYGPAAPLFDEFVAAFPKDKAAQAGLLGQLAMEQYRGERAGWRKAKPIADRLLKDYRDEAVTPRVLGRIALGRLQSAPQDGLKMLEALTRDFPGSESVAAVWAQLTLQAHQRGQSERVAERLKLLADKFARSESRAQVLATFAYQDFRQKGLAAIRPALGRLEADIRHSQVLPRVMIRMATEHLRRVGHEQGAPFVAEVLKKYGEHEDARQLAGIDRRLRTVGRECRMSFVAVDGAQVDVAKMRGKVVVVYFWATWCAPCTAGMSRTVSLAEKFKDRGVRFVGVSLDMDRRRLLEYLEEKKLPWPSAFDGKGWGSELVVHWGITSVPHFLVIDRAGKLVNAGTANKDEVEATLSRLTGG